MPDNELILNTLTSKIYEIRGQRVMLDEDLAELYGVETSQLKRAVRRNIERFEGDDFMFQLTVNEFNELKSSMVCQNGISKQGGNRFQNFAFTEMGVAMLSSVLRSETAIQVNRNIMRAFVAIRKYLSVQGSGIEVLEYRMKQIEETMNDILGDQNEINEDTRMRLELIEESLAALQTKNIERAVVKGFKIKQ